MNSLLTSADGFLLYLMSLYRIGIPFREKIIIWFLNTLINENLYNYLLSYSHKITDILLKFFSFKFVSNKNFVSQIV